MGRVCKTGHLSQKWPVALLLSDNVKSPAFRQGFNEYGFQLTENIVFYTAGKRLCFSYSLYL